MTYNVFGGTLNPTLLYYFCWSYSLEFTAKQSAQSSCWARAVSTDSENPPVYLLLAFR